jgi:hypothetical protein
VDIGGFSPAGPVASFQRLNPVNNTYVLCTSSRTNNFALTGGESYRVRTTADRNYIIVGSHDPVKNITLKGPASGVSATGTNEYAYPYHSTAINCDNLAVEIGGFSPGGPVASVQNLNVLNNTYTLCTSSRTNNFSLVAGTGYRVRVTADKTIVPSHY